MGGIFSIEFYVDYRKGNSWARFFEFKNVGSNPWQDFIAMFRRSKSDHLKLSGGQQINNVLTLGTYHMVFTYHTIKQEQNVYINKQKYTKTGVEGYPVTCLLYTSPSPRD